MTPQRAEDVALSLRAGASRGAIARGLGRSYGDAAQNSGGLAVDCTGLDSIGPISKEGLVTVDGGTSLDDLARAGVPQGWFLPVTPGTRFVTVGGAIAADVHGKNHHHDGSLAAHVTSLTLALPDGDVCTVSPDEDAALFWATTGGMGLTGVVLRATLRLLPVSSCLLRVDTDRTRDLDETMAVIEQADKTHRYSVAWLDLLHPAAPGRGVVACGDHAAIDDLPASLRPRALEYRPRTPLPAPARLPSGLVNRMTARAFNELWFRRAPVRAQGELEGIETFFYPLDRVGGWNRLYGRQGFLQYQCVVPFGAESALRRIIRDLAAAPVPPALAVLKRCGPAANGPLSFPIPGWTLAVDFPARPGTGLDALLDACDRRVAAAGGRVYLAKDSRMQRGMLEAMYPRLDEWRDVVNAVDPQGRLASDLDRRLDLTGRHGLRARP